MEFVFGLVAPPCEASSSSHVITVEIQLFIILFFFVLEIRVKKMEDGKVEGKLVRSHSFVPLPCVARESLTKHKRLSGWSWVKSV